MTEFPKSPTPAEIKSARKAAGLTQPAAADLIYHSGHAWRKWEAGTRKMRPLAFESFKAAVKYLRRAERPQVES